MSLSHETITVEKVTQYGVRADGKNYGLSPKLKQSNVTPIVFRVGATYNVEVWTGPQGGKSINGYSEVGVQPFIPPVPALPPTTVASTPAPGGVAPVAPAKRGVGVNEVVDLDKMSKADWANKDYNIAILAIMGGVLKGSSYGQASVGKNENEILATGDRMIDHFVEKFNSLRRG